VRIPRWRLYPDSYPSSGWRKMDARTTVGCWLRTCLWSGTRDHTVPHNSPFLCLASRYKTRRKNFWYYFIARSHSHSARGGVTKLYLGQSIRFPGLQVRSHILDLQRLIGANFVRSWRLTCKARKGGILSKEETSKSSQ